MTLDFKINDQVGESKRQFRINFMNVDQGNQHYH